MNTTLLDYLRHGLPKGGSHYRGHGIDDPLSKAGWAQMHATTAVLGGWQAVISSPLVRCATFAQWLTETHDLPLHIDEDLREVGFGNWEGRTRAELIAECPDEYHAFYAQSTGRRRTTGGLWHSGGRSLPTHCRPPCWTTCAGGRARRGDPRHPGACTRRTA